MSSSTQNAKSNTLRTRLISVLKTAIQRYGGNIPNNSPTTIVRDCKDVNDSSGKPMECLTDKATAVDLTRFANEPWSDVYMTNASTGGARQCVPGSVNRSIERREKRADKSETPRTAKEYKRNTMLETINAENRRLHELNRTIQKMPAYKNSYNNQNQCGGKISRQACYETTYPNTNLQKCYWSADAEQITSSDDAQCKDLKYEEKAMRYLDEKDINGRREGKTFEESESTADKFPTESKPGDKYPVNQYLPQIRYAYRKPNTKRDPVTGLTVLKEPLLSDEYVGRYLIPCRDANYTANTKGTIEKLVSNFYDKPMSQPETSEGVEEVPQSQVRPSSELAETIVNMLQAGEEKESDGPVWLGGGSGSVTISSSGVITTSSSSDYNNADYTSFPQEEALNTFCKEWCDIEDMFGTADRKSKARAKLVHRVLHHTQLKKRKVYDRAFFLLSLLSGTTFQLEQSYLVANHNAWLKQSYEEKKNLVTKVLNKIDRLHDGFLSTAKTQGDLGKYPGGSPIDTDLQAKYKEKIANIPAPDKWKELGTKKIVTAEELMRFAFNQLDSNRNLSIKYSDMKEYFPGLEGYELRDITVPDDKLADVVSFRKKYREDFMPKVLEGSDPTAAKPVAAALLVTLGTQKSVEDQLKELQGIDDYANASLRAALTKGGATPSSSIDANFAVRFTDRGYYFKGFANNSENLKGIFGEFRLYEITITDTVKFLAAYGVRDDRPGSGNLKGPKFVYTKHIVTGNYVEMTYNKDANMGTATGNTFDDIKKIERHLQGKTLVGGETGDLLMLENELAKCQMAYDLFFDMNNRHAQVFRDLLQKFSDVSNDLNLKDVQDFVKEQNEFSRVSTANISTLRKHKLRERNKAEIARGLSEKEYVFRTQIDAALKRAEKAGKYDTESHLLEKVSNSIMYMTNVNNLRRAGILKPLSGLDEDKVYEGIQSYLQTMRPMLDYRNYNQVAHDAMTTATDFTAKMVNDATNHDSIFDLVVKYGLSTNSVSSRTNIFNELKTIVTQVTTGDDEDKYFKRIADAVKANQGYFVSEDRLLELIKDPLAFSANKSACINSSSSGDEMSRDNLPPLDAEGRKFRDILSALCRAARVKNMSTSGGPFEEFFLDFRCRYHKMFNNRYQLSVLTRLFDVYANECCDEIQELIRSLQAPLPNKLEFDAAKRADPSSSISDREREQLNVQKKLLMELAKEFEGITSRMRRLESTLI